MRALHINMLLNLLQPGRHQIMIPLQVLNLLDIRVIGVAQRLNILQVHIHLQVMQRVLLIVHLRQLLLLHLHPLLHLPRLVHVQLLIVLANIRNHPLQLILVELDLLVEGQRGAQLRHLVEFPLIDLLDKLDVLAERLVVVFDADASEELVVESVQQLDESGPSVVAIGLVALDVLDFGGDRLLQVVV